MSIESSLLKEPVKVGERLRLRLRTGTYLYYFENENDIVPLEPIIIRPIWYDIIDDYEIKLNNMYTNVIIATFLLLSFGIKDIKLSSNDNFSINEYYKEQYTSKKSLEIYLSANDYSRLPDSLLLLSFNYTKFSENKLNDCIKSLLSAKKIFYETHDENESDSIQEFIKYWKVTQPWCYGKFLQIMPMLHYSFDVPNKELAYRLTKVNCNILYKISHLENNGITTYIDPKSSAISFSKWQR